MYADILKLKRAGYKVEELSPWHYQVKQGDTICNIWPSKRKYMREFDNGASIYLDVVEAVAHVVGPAHTVETRAERIARLKKYWAEEIPVPQNPEAYAAWRYEIDLLVKYVARVIQKRDDMDF